MERDMMNHQHEFDEKKMQASGVIFKSVIGLMVAFGVAIPRLFEGDYAFGFIYAGGFFSDFIMVTIFSIIMGFIWYALYKSLRKDKGTLINWVVYLFTMFFLGLFFGNALIAAVGWISYYGQVDAEMVRKALEISGLATFFAILAGIIMLPRIKLSGKTAGVFENLAKLVAALFLLQFVFFALGLFLNIFGISFMWQIYGAIFYSTNLFSIFLTFLVSVFAVIVFIGTLGTVKYQIGRAPKHMEFYYSALLVNGLVRVYVEIFKLVLKIMVRRNND